VKKKKFAVEVTDEEVRTLHWIVYIFVLGELCIVLNQVSCHFGEPIPFHSAP
jgi:hypothetical protein